MFLDKFDPNEPNPDDLRGGKRAARRFVDWQTFFNFGDGNFRPNKKIDTKLSTVLLELLGLRGPAPGMPADGQQSLASRNLMRHVNFGLPSGQAVARLMGVQVLSPAQFGIVCFRLKPKGMSEDQLNEFNERVNDRVNRSGFVLMSSTRLRGALSLRLCIPGYRTREEDVRAVLDLVRQTGRDVLGV